MRRSWSGFLFRPWTKKLGRRSRTGQLGGVLGELTFYLGLVVLGVFTLSLVLITHLMVPRIGLQIPDEARLVLESELVRGGGGHGRWIVGLVSIAAFGSGMTGLFYRLVNLGFSQERLSARSQRIRGLRHAGESPSTHRESTDADVPSRPATGFPELPNVPPTGSIAESPGERLAFRLANVSSGRWNLFGIAALALTWNCVWWVLLAVVLSGWWIDRNRPILAILLVPFFAISIWSLRLLWRQVRQIAGVGPTILEISDHPLQPGMRYDVFVSQMGRMRLRRLAVRLECEEESFFRQGTDVRAERHVAISQDLLVEKALQVDPRAPFEQQFSLDVPANAMHSFSAANNAVRWRLVVSGESRPWPSFCRSFPVIVHPQLMVPPANPR